MKILVVDNNDSFTYNIIGLLKSLRIGEIQVEKSDTLLLNSVKDFDKIIFSPGPGLPKDFNILRQILQQYKHQKSILGICLGHQAIGDFFGAKLINLFNVYHGQAHKIQVNTANKLYQHIPNTFSVGLYHSWAVSQENLPNSLICTGMSENGIIMSISHKEYDIHGIQYHPESFMSEFGKQIMTNFLN